MTNLGAMIDIINIIKFAIFLVGFYYVIKVLRLAIKKLEKDDK